MPRASINGTELYYGTHGEGPPLVFAHGVGGNHASWYHQVATFRDENQVVVFDHRGFGNSLEAPDGPGRAAFVDDLLGLLDHLKIDRATLVAQSMGGATCLGMALHHPDRVSALVMADTLGGITAPGRLRERQEEVRKATSDLSQVDRVVSHDFQRREPAQTQLYLELASFNATNRFNTHGAATAPPTQAELNALSMPVLFLVGEHDVLAPPDMVRMGHEMIPGSQLVEIPGAGHSAYFEKPDFFNRALMAFLRVPATAGTVS